MISAFLFWSVSELIIDYLPFNNKNSDTDCVRIYIIAVTGMSLQPPLAFAPRLRGDPWALLSSFMDSGTVVPPVNVPLKER